MNIQSTLTAIRDFDKAAFNRETCEYRVDFRCNDPRLIAETAPGKGSAFYCKDPAVALSAAERMTNVSWFIDPAAHRQHIAGLNVL
ncbi:hypothetical protein [Methylobacterium ajmalii]|jgi:hypothetical protein|uniref:hypothetical protein n=1 Tax=Methylobacterium ajmalii TaxID=2738439 RepID=UPI00190A8551|nr:hypothetical protein [Methylobacterium ajmalii]MBK3400853.1 hypothetical protein [Methylobacterium ajmalii]MBK3410928.1 hypothetical protein [Methylobacterium ajmalii]MBK3421909.1 hypothetical protein [Methylobacterium ajmalii]MBZ6417155.1 hypothetical protein [Methylobacterium sp.]